MTSRGSEWCRPVARTTKSWALLLFLWSVLSAVPLVASLDEAMPMDCRCGYTLDVNDRALLEDQLFFTDLLESNFENMTRIDIDQNTDWRRQQFNVPAKAARGPFGKMMDINNVQLVPAEHNREKRVLRLAVGSSPVQDMIPSAEISTSRLDIKYGSFRTSMKVTDVPGTCTAFFWYFSDTQEIDMEFLSKDFNNSNSSWPVNLVLQSREAAMEGYDASKTSNFHRVYLPYNPTDGFHEYRIDYLEHRVSFYMDDVLLKHMDGPNAAIPTTKGHIILQHWSNGDPLWSGGPPVKEAVMLVRWVKAYFNSSEPGRYYDWRVRCGSVSQELRALSLCQTPTSKPEDKFGPNWFYTEHPGLADNQIFFGNDSPGGRGWSWTWASSSLLAGVWAYILLW